MVSAYIEWMISTGYKTPSIFTGGGNIPQEEDIICLNPRDEYGYDPVRGGCFERFVFRSWTSLGFTALVYIAVPIGNTNS
jgi:hypothetical protein